MNEKPYQEGVLLGQQFERADAARIACSPTWPTIESHQRLTIYNASHCPSDRGPSETPVAFPPSDRDMLTCTHVTGSNPTPSRGAGVGVWRWVTIRLRDQVLEPTSISALLQLETEPGWISPKLWWRGRPRVPILLASRCD